MLSFKPTFSLSTFTFIKRLFSSSSLSAIRVVSSAYLRWLIFLPAILIPACVSSRPAFLMIYSADKLNKQGDNIQTWCTPFPIIICNLQWVLAIVCTCIISTPKQDREYYHHSRNLTHSIFQSIPPKQSSLIFDFHLHKVFFFLMHDLYVIMH